MPSIALLVFAVIAGLAVHDQLRARPLNVILITVESWRADSVTEEHMPHLLRESGPRGVQFTNHRAVSAWTGPNVIALLSGLSPFEQNVHTRGDSIPSEPEVATETFARSGWRVDGLQAFMQIDLFKNLGLEIETGVDLKHWLATRARNKRPFYLWYHYLPTHLPYQQEYSETAGLYFPSEEDIAADLAFAARLEAVRTQPVIPEGSVEFQPGDRRWIEPAYIGGIRDFDEWFAEFWRFYRRTGLSENTILVVTADHGEELLERGNVGHASTTRAGHLHEEIVHVPLFVWMPTDLLGVWPGRVFDHSTDHMMIAGMLKRLVGLDAVDATVKGDDEPYWLPPLNEDWFALTSVAGFAEPDPDRVNRFVAAAGNGPIKVQVEVDDGRIVGLLGWNLDNDPGETRPIPEPDAEYQRLLGLLEDKLANLPARKPGGSGSDRASGNAPDWVHPNGSRRIGYDDVAGATYLEWSGLSDARYIVEYKAGSGVLSLDGELDVEGTRYDFGEIGRSYWSTWVLPYERIRFRVRPAAGGRWSDWLELEFDE